MYTLYSLDYKMFLINYFLLLQLYCQNGVLKKHHLNINVPFVHILLIKLLILKIINGYIQEKDHLNAIFVQNPFLRRLIYNLIYVLILENAHLPVYFAAKNFLRKYTYKSINVFKICKL